MKSITVIILTSVSLNAAAQVLMRHGMKRMGEVPFTAAAILKALPSMLSNGFLWSAFFCYVLSIILWMAVLSRVEVSLAYAFSSLGFVFVVLFSFIFLKENINLYRITGTLVVCIGIFLVSRG
jgi:drug/metabolite transporter (DMT)-like permease